MVVMIVDTSDDNDSNANNADNNRTATTTNNKNDDNNTSNSSSNNSSSNNTTGRTSYEPRAVFDPRSSRSVSTRAQHGSPFRGKILHTGNRHLRNHRGFSVAWANGLSVACSNIIVRVSGMFQRIVTCPVDLLLELSNVCSVAFSYGI